MAERNIGKEILEGLRELKRDRTGRSTMVSQVSPGEMLHEEFLKPLRMSHHRLAKEIGVPMRRIEAIVTGRRAITADTDLRLCRFFGLAPGWWLKHQIDHDLRKAKARLVYELAKITPLKKPR